MENSTDSSKGNAYEDLLIMTAMNNNKDLENLIENSSGEIRTKFYRKNIFFNRRYNKTRCRRQYKS